MNFSQIWNYDRQIYFPYPFEWTDYIRFIYLIRILTSGQPNNTAIVLGLVLALFVSGTITLAVWLWRKKILQPTPAPRLTSPTTATNLYQDIELQQRTSQSCQTAAEDV